MHFSFTFKTSVCNCEIIPALHMFSLAPIKLIFFYSPKL